MLLVAVLILTLLVLALLKHFSPGPTVAAIISVARMPKISMLEIAIAGLVLASVVRFAGL